MSSTQEAKHGLFFCAKILQQLSPPGILLINDTDAPTFATISSVAKGVEDINPTECVETRDAVEIAVGDRASDTSDDHTRSVSFRSLSLTYPTSLDASGPSVDCNLA